MSSPGGESAVPARAIVAGHGDFAAGLVTAVAQITGRDGVFIAMSNRDLCTADVEGRLRELVDAEGVGVIFTDLPAGSCTMAARRVQRERPDLLVVTGTNLATLLEWAMSDGPRTLESLLRVVDKGRSTLAILGGPKVGPTTPATTGAPTSEPVRGR